MKLNVRQYAVTDFPTLVPMAQEMHCNEDGVSHLTREQFALTIDYFTQHTDCGKVLTLEYENEICGYAILVFYWSNDWSGQLIYLDELFIAADFRNRGLGELFLKWLRNEYRETAAALFLETTPDKPRAASLYQRFGFVPAENAYWMYPFRIIKYPTDTSDESVVQHTTAPGVA
ncbi:MAG: GNAT family N-acetyltransferase [bacterium]|nr:GNAT family N-acetyltransferase [bacterium]